MNSVPSDTSKNIRLTSSGRMWRSRVIWLLLLIVIAGAAWFWWHRRQATVAPESGAPALTADAAKSGGARRGKGGGAGGGGANRPVPVQVGKVYQGEFKVYLGSLGSVTPTNSVVVRTRVDGQLLRLNFKEGQMVRAGQVLAEIDQQPLLVQLAQMEGQLAKDAAQLQNARRDLARYQGLLAQDSISRQQVDTTDALVRQYDGVVKSDQAQIDSVKLQLSYTRVTAPLNGLLGLRQVDAGNMIHASDTNGIVTINQVQPVNVVFTLAESQLASVLASLHAGKVLRVEAWDRGQKQMLATGRVASTDNQIDLTTGTIKVKALFANDDSSLFPNQFVNVHLLAETHQDATIAPSAAVQRGRDGPFVYLVKQDRSVTQRLIKTGATDGDVIEVTSGLRPGDAVVIDGIDQLREGAMVEVADSTALLKERPKGMGRGGRGRIGASSAPAASDQSGAASSEDKGHAAWRPRADAGDDAAPVGQSRPQGGWRARQEGAAAPQGNGIGDRPQGFHGHPNSPDLPSPQAGQSAPQAGKWPAGGDRPRRRPADDAARSSANN